MELWIRSQDRESLIKCNQIDIMWVDGYPCVFLNSNFPDNVVGSYLTKERALEILDEIQKLLTPQVCELAQKLANNEYSDYNKLTNVYAIMDNCGSVNVSQLSTVVYEMPEE
jgi:hypothetical protein